MTRSVEDLKSPEAGSPVTHEHSRPRAELHPGQATSIHTESASPLYEHDSDCCTFLGSFQNEADLYFCDQGGKLPTVIARYGGLGHQYTSGLIFADTSPWLGEAKRRAIARGLLTDEDVSK